MNGVQLTSWQALKEGIISTGKVMLTTKAGFAAGVIALGVAFGVLADRVYNAEKYAKKALDESADKVDEVRSEIDSLNSELKTTQDRIDELNSKENLTLVEQDELNRLKETNDELERELRLKQSILSKEEKEANKDAKKYFTTKKDSLNFETSYEGVEIHEETDYIGTVEERIDRLQQYAEGNIQLSEETIASYKDYVESAISDFMQEDDYLVKGLDDGILDRLDALYEKYDIYTNGRGSVVEEKISGILAKVDFQNEAKQLEELGKDGSLSIDALASRFPDLIKYLNDAGVSAEELYQYIMALSNPDAINYQEVEKQFLEQLGIRDGAVGGASDQKIYDEVKSLGLLENESLEAYLTVRTKFTDGQTTEWSPKDWADYIQKEINGELASDEMSVLNIRDYLNQEDLKDTKDELFNLFKTGELNEDSINSIREFRDMLTATGLSAKDAVNEIEQFFEASNETIDLSDWKTQLNEARNAINSLKTIKGEIGSGYSDSSINTIISDYPQLLAYLDDESSMLEAVNNLLDEQSSKAEIAANKILEFDPNIYKEVITQVYSDLEQSNSSLIQTLATGYGIDLNNFSSLAQAKEEIDKQLLQTLMEMWGEYYGIVVDSVTGLASVTQNLPDFYQNEEAQNQLATYNQIITKLNATADKFNNGLDFGSLGDDASKAGSSDGDAYVEAYEKELKELGKLRDRGEITEAEYLSRMKALYERYFKGISKYQDKYFEEQGKYLSGMLDLYNSALSGISKLLGNKIDAVQKEKDATISALEEERDARLEVIEAQKEQLQAEIDLIDEQIDAKQEIIDGIQDEIDKMREANEERKRQQDLMLAQYNLQKMLSQRTKLVKYMPDTIVI